MVGDHIASLEGLVRDLEKVSFHLTSKKPHTALNSSASSSSSSDGRHSGHVSGHLGGSHGHSHSAGGNGGTSNPLALGDASSGSGSGSLNNSRSGILNSNNGNNNNMHTPTKGRNLIEFTPGAGGDAGDGSGGHQQLQQQQRDISGRSGSEDLTSGETPARSKHDFNSITDALVQVEALKFELERVQIGLALLGLSVEKLMDIVTVEPACCSSIFDLFIPRSIQTIGRESTGAHTFSQQQTRYGGQGSGGGGGGGRSSLGIGARTTDMFKNRQIKKAGYKNINSSGNSGGFSIEGAEDDEDVDL
jgi:hypothetical protein